MVESKRPFWSYQGVPLLTSASFCSAAVLVVSVVCYSPYTACAERVELTDVNTLLSVALKRADEVTQQGEYALAVKWRLKCVALVRLVYGDGHWRLGQAHCQLARAYLELRGQRSYVLRECSLYLCMQLSLFVMVIVGLLVVTRGQ